jgi:hypothetical protein
MKYISFDVHILLLYISGIFINLLNGFGASVVSFFGGVGLIIFTIYKAKLMKKRADAEDRVGKLKEELLQLQIDKLKNQ